MSEMSYKMSASSRDTVDESILIADCRKGDLDAFEVIVFSYQRMLYNVALRITGNEADSAEIVQDTFVQAWRKIGEFRGESKLSTWLTSITVNQARTCRQKHRHRLSREEALDSTQWDRACFNVSSSHPSPLEKLEQAELRELLELCIAALDQVFREVLVLRDIRELPYDEVLQILGLRQGTLKSRLFRAREAVRDCVVRKIGKL